MGRDEVPQARPPAHGETTEGGPAAARHAARAQQDEPPPWDEQEPGWLDPDAPLDPEGDERDWEPPGEYAEVRRLAALAQADEDQAHDRIIAGGIEHGYAHTTGAAPIPGVKDGPAGGFGQDEPYDTAAPEPFLAAAADYASGAGRDFTGVCDDEVFGVLGARQRLTSRQQWETLATISELIRRRPAPGAVILAPSGMPAVWGEGLAGELVLQLAVSRRYAESLLGLAWDLRVKLPVTSVMLRDGIMDQAKASAVAAAFADLTAAQAMAAEEILYRLGDTGSRTLGTIRDRAARAAVEIDPDAARKRREQGARERRVEIRPEDSGNASIAGRELPPAAVLEMDAALTARAKELKKLGIPGDMNELRAQAFMERFGVADPVAGLHRSTTRTGEGDSEGEGEHGAQDGDGDGNGDGGGGGGRGPRPGSPGPSAGPCPACGRDSRTGAGSGLAVRMHLTAPVTTLTEQAGRPGYLHGTGPADPDFTRDLAHHAASSTRTTYCFTLTDPDGRPVAHACGEPAPGDPARRRPRKKSKPGNTASAGPPPDTGSPQDTGPPGSTGPPELTLADPGPPGSYGRWRYTHGTREILFEFEDIAGPCDHAHQAAGHDPGRLLLHLTGILNADCTSPGCRRPQAQCDYEHSLAYDDGGITCLCQAGPVCRRDHRDKQRSGWKLEDTGDRGWYRWTTPSGRTYLNGPTIYPD